MEVWFSFVDAIKKKLSLVEGCQPRKGRPMTIDFKPHSASLSVLPFCN